MNVPGRIYASEKLLKDMKKDKTFEQVKNIALSGKKMPQKSTYFYPKLITGLVIYKIE